MFYYLFVAALTFLQNPSFYSIISPPSLSFRYRPLSPDHWLTLAGKLLVYDKRQRESGTARASRTRVLLSTDRPIQSVTAIPKTMMIKIIKTTTRTMTMMTNNYTISQTRTVVLPAKEVLLKSEVFYCCMAPDYYFVLAMCPANDKEIKLNTTNEYNPTPSLDKRSKTTNNC